MNDHTRHVLSALSCTPTGASEDTLKSISSCISGDLPDDYLMFLRFSDGIEGPIGAEDYLILYSAQEVLQSAKDNGTTEYAPGLLLIGTNGGNAAYGIDLRAENSGTEIYVEMDFTSLDWDEVFYSAASFDTLIQRLAAK